MNEGSQRHPCEQELVFFGRIGADVTHDVRNVLSVIGEYAGLLDDLLAMSGQGRPVDGQKLQKLSAGLSGQVRKGTEIMERFSRFSHATDERTVSFDLVELAQNMAAMVQRRVNLAGCRLETELPRKPIPVTSSPFSLQHAIFCAIEHVLDLPDRGELITMTVEKRRPAAAISIAAAADGDGLSCSPAHLASVMEPLNGTADAACADGTLTLTLTISLK